MLNYFEYKTKIGLLKIYKYNNTIEIMLDDKLLCFGRDKIIEIKDNELFFNVFLYVCEELMNKIE